MKLIPCAFAALLGCTMLPALAASTDNAAKVGAGKTAAAAPAAKNRIVFQINEENVKKWNEVLVNRILNKN